MQKDLETALLLQRYRNGYRHQQKKLTRERSFLRPSRIQCHIIVSQLAIAPEVFSSHLRHGKQTTNTEPFSRKALFLEFSCFLFIFASPSWSGCCARRLFPMIRSAVEHIRLLDCELEIYRAHFLPSLTEVMATGGPLQYQSSEVQWNTIH